MMIWDMLNPEVTPAHLGELPYFLDEKDPEPARKQLHKNYLHGGGWNPFPGFILGRNNCLVYPGDPPVYPLAQTKLRDELIVFYDYAWVAIIQPDGSFEVSRMD